MFYIATKDGLSISFPGNKTFQVAKDHVNFDKVLKAVQNGEPTFEEIEKLVDLKKAITSIESDGVKFSLNAADELTVTIDGVEAEILDQSLEYRLIQTIRDEDNDLRKAAVQAFGKFLRNLYKNPSYQSVRQLYGFLDKNDLPITQNGTFLAYKKVRHDYLDIHSHSFDNSIGKVVTMPRYMVEDNPEVTCSRGLHVCSYDYLDHYAESTLDRVIICEVDPADVVSVPYDYNNAKMRTCGYKVVDEVPTHFQAKLASYIYGDHEEGWINKTFTGLIDLYKSFFGVDTVEINQLPDTIRVIPAVVESFITASRNAGFSVPEKYTTAWTDEERLPTLGELFQILSKYDSNWQKRSTKDAE